MHEYVLQYLLIMLRQLIYQLVTRLLSAVPESEMLLCHIPRAGDKVLSRVYVNMWLP